MTPARWHRVGELFHEALELPPHQCRPWLQTVCADDPELLGEVLSLLGSDKIAAEGFIEDQVKPAVISLLESNTGQPTRVGPYRLVRELGRGGMGTVYLAERDDDQYQTQVAIKLVRRGMDTDLILNRFRRERQTLARLQHPHIARLLDGSTTDDGLPYIVMEYVNGAKITDYCRDQNLTLHQRLELFLNVSSAVDYAHRHFVVHRDLKPGNIMVDETGSVKLLDFGICKLLQAETGQGSETIDGCPAPLTPDYASPEQIRGDPVTVTSDVYSLAAVLYELLTGAKPHQKGTRDNEVSRPSTHKRQLAGDLDTILLHALQQDPNRRYPSVEQFSEDIRRHLAHQPVKARPDTVTYRIEKFVRRRHGLVAAVAAVILALSIGVFLALRSARIANENLALVRQLSNTFVFEVHDAVRDLPGSTRARQLIVQTGLKYLDNLSRNATGDFELQRELAAAYHRIGDVQGQVLGANLGNTTEALASYEKALALLKPVPSNRQTLTARIVLHQRIGDLHSYTKDLNHALKDYREAEAQAKALLASNPEDEPTGRQLAGIHLATADVVRLAGDYVTSLAESAKAMVLFKQYAERHPDDQALQSSLASAYSAVGMCDVRLGRLKEGLEGYRQAAARMERAVALDPANVSNQRGLMFAYAHIGDVLGNPNLPNLGDTNGAIEAYGRMSDVARRVHEADPADQRAMSDYGVALSRAAVAMPPRRVQERITLLRKSLELQQEVERVNPANLSNRGDMAFTYYMLGEAFQSARDSAGAVRAFKDGAKQAEGMIKAGSGGLVLTAIFLYRKLGEEAGAAGDEQAALAAGRRVVELAGPSMETAKGRPADLQRFLTPRGPTAMGIIYAALAASGRGNTREYTKEARRHLEDGLALWRALQSNPGYAIAHQREVRAAETALAGLK